MQNSFMENPATSGQGKVLTPRQREIVRLLAEGKTMRQAGGILKITQRTVAFHKYTVMRRFNLGSNADLVRFAINHGITA